ncbi:MAG TPA: hypothetical protein VJN92_07515, partial [Candidatus Acidoferrum sp.]|nr:hypothetical protein [Candidatus Acidoferrum sp.]
PDIDLRLGISPHCELDLSTKEEELVNASFYTTETGEPVYRLWRLADGALIRIAYFDGTQFWLDRKYEKLWAIWPSVFSLEDASTYLLGPVMGILLRLRGVTCLHASAVAFGECSVAFVGWAGAGKSTTAAAFARRGQRILSDDIVALEEEEEDFYVLPAYPHLCLWPDSVNALYGSPEALPRFVPDWEKRRLSLSEEARFENRALPLRAIYILGERRPDPGPTLESVAPRVALISLVAESYANKFLDRELRAREFEVLGRMATRIPIRRVHAHEDAGRLEDLCRLIRKDLAELEVPIAARH